MFSRLLFIVGFASLVINVSAQKFQTGYYITLSGDTVRTEMFVQKLYGCPTGIQLKNGRVLGPLSVEGFGTADASFISKIVTADKTPKQESVPDTVFLEVLVRGKVSLLYYRDESPKTHFFIQKEDESLEELGLKILDLGDHKQFSRLTTYKDVLKKNFAECKDLFPEIDKTSYDRFDVQQIFLRLYNCKYGQALSSISTKQGAFVEFGFMVGVVQNNIAFKDDINSPLTYMTFSKSTSFTGGGYLEIIFPRMSFMFLRNELIFSAYSTSAPETDTNADPANQNRASAELQSSSLRYNLLFRKNLSKKEFSPFVNIGASLSVPLSRSGSITESKSIFGNMYYKDTRPFPDAFVSIEVGIIAGLGVTFKKFGFEGRYELSDGSKPVDSRSSSGLFTIVTAPSSPVNSFYFVFSYQLSDNKKSKSITNRK